MPKVTNPLFSGDARGKFGNKMIFTRGGVVRRYFKPRNPNTEAQQAVRNAFKDLYMTSLTKEQADLLYALILHTHDELYAALNHDHDGDYSPVGHDHAGVFSSTPVALTDGATPALDASLGSFFTLAAEGNRTIAVPTNPTAGQSIIIEHYASGGARTLSLNTGAGGFILPSTITITQTVSGKRDYIGAKYSGGLGKWAVLAYQKGF